MRDRAQMVLDLVHVLCREAPIVVSQVIEAGEAVALDAACHIDVRVEVAPDQLPQVSKYWFSSMQAKVARAANRTPQTILLKDEDDMIEQIY